VTTTHDLPDGPPASPVDEGRALAGRWTIGARYDRRGEVHFHRATDANGPVWVAAWRYRGFEPLPRFLVHLGHDREAWSAVRHPSVARTLDVGREVGETTCFWVVRALPGVLLSDHLAVPGGIDRALAVSTAMQVGEALAAIHSMGLVHGAVRPDTVVLGGASSRVQLAWGGLVPRLARAGVDTGSGPVDLGATAPEILAGGSASAETDVYGLAALLFTLLHGRTPFGPAEPGVSTDDLPRALTDLIERGLRRDADLRPGLHALTEHLGDLAADLGWDAADRPEDPPLAPLPTRGSAPPPVDRRIPTHTPPIVHRTIEPAARRADGDTALANTPTSAGRRPLPVTPATLARSVEPRSDPVVYGAPILAPAPSRLQSSLVAVVLALSVVVAVIAAAVWLMRSAPAALPPPSADPAPIEAPASPPAAVLTVRTEPPGAEVWEGETLLGTTPLELPLGDATRTLELRAEGYATTTIVQPPSSASVQHNVALQRARARSQPLPPDLELREQR